MSAFSITTATNNIQIGKERRAAILFTVTNQTGQALTGRAAVAAVPPEGAPAAGAHAAWVAPLAQSERPFALNGVQDYTVEVNVPAGAPAGDYTFRLDMVATHNPDETYTAGPTVVLTVVEQPQPRRFPKWLIPLIIAIVVILVVGGLVLFLLWPRGTRVPNVVERPVSEAQATVTAAGLAFQKAGEVAGEEVPAGIVLGTTPEAGERVREGTPVLYVESGGPAEQPVPDVVGLAVDDALATLEAEGFRHRPGGNEFSEDVAAGLVARTDPGAGTPAALDSRVVWFESAGPPPTETPTPTPTIALPDAGDLEGINWVLQSYLDDTGELVGVLADTDLTARFEGGQVGGRSGCNSFGGPYQVSGNTLQVGQISSTLILCFSSAVMEQERTYLALLRSSASFLAPDNGLEILDSTGQTILVFSKALSLQLTPFPISTLVISP